MRPIQTPWSPPPARLGVAHHRPAALAWLAALALLVSLAACGDDADTNGTQTDTGGDVGTTDTADPGPDAEPAAWEPTLYRVDALNIDQPANLGPLIGQLVRRDIRDGRLNILIETGNFGAESGTTTFEIRGGAGETPDGTAFRLVADVPWVPAEVEADGQFANTELLILDFPVLLSLPPSCDGEACPDNECRDNADCSDPYTCDSEGDGQCVQAVVLPLKDIQIEGRFATGDEGQPVISATGLEGAILKEDADAIEVGLPGQDTLLLSDLLGEGNLNYPDRDNPTGWRLSALINAEAVPPAE